MLLHFVAKWNFMIKISYNLLGNSNGEKEEIIRSIRMPAMIAPSV